MPKYFPFFAVLIIAIGLLSAYFIYGSTLVDITSDKSISNALATDPNQPITIIKRIAGIIIFNFFMKLPLSNRQEKILACFVAIKYQYANT